MLLMQAGARALAPEEDAFGRVLEDRGLGRLRRGVVTTLQVNVGKLCNMACHHCHVEAGPKRAEIMPREIAEQVVRLVERSPRVEVVDLTGGAPELNPSFRWLVRSVRELGRRVIDRCNLTVLYQPGQEDLPDFLAEHGAEVVASLPCYSAANVEKQRGKGAFDKSVTALQRLNALGYGKEGSSLRLDLVFNPVGPTLPPSQQALEAKYKVELSRLFGIEFHRLLTITNMPIRRFADALARSGRADEYLSLLVNHFNPRAVSGVMCRTLLSVGYDGRLYDCDFNQMLALPLGGEAGGLPGQLAEVASLECLEEAEIATDSHCFACTAGSGSSCGGKLV
jgi:radical SAM/Cys-rich protein